MSCQVIIDVAIYNDFRSPKLFKISNATKFINKPRTDMPIMHPELSSGGATIRQQTPNVHLHSGVKVYFDIEKHCIRFRHRQELIKKILEKTQMNRRKN